MPNHQPSLSKHIGEKQETQCERISIKNGTGGYKMENLTHVPSGKQNKD